MGKKLRWVLGTVAAVSGVGLAWRFASRRLQIPCPPWLGWMLENPVVEALHGGGWILERIGLQQGMRVLDAGCGPGRLTLRMAEWVGPAGEVVALDVQPDMLREVERRVAARGVTNVRTVEAALGRTALERDAFDRIVMVTVLGEVPDREAALGGLFQALRPGGVLSITELLPDPHYQPVGTVRRLAREAGFKEQEFFGNFLAYTLNLARPGEPAPEA